MDYRVKINSKLIPFLRTDKRFKIIIGGRGSGKSVGVADIMLVKCMQGLKIACFREFQNSIGDSVISLLKAEIERLQMPGFSSTRDSITHTSGGHFTFRGLARNAESLKSMHDFDIAWIEEAQTVSEESLQLLTPTIRKEGSELWFTGNPRRSEDPFSQRFIERSMNDINGIEQDDLHMRIMLNYVDNPKFPSSLDIERQDDYQRLPRALYDHVWLGAYNDSVENSIILSEWFDACIDSHSKLGFKASGAIVTAHDPADSGDARGTIIRHGNIITSIDEELILDINEACDKAMHLATDNRSSHFVYDGDGCGIGLRRQVTDYFEPKNVEIIAFHGGSAPENPDLVIDSSNYRERTNRDAYTNLRAQKYQQIAIAMQKTYQAVEQKVYINPDELLSIDSSAGDIRKLKAELCSIPQIYNTAGKFQVMSKQQMMQKLKLKSPNLADCVMMSMIELKKNKKWGKSIAPSLNFA